MFGMGTQEILLILAIALIFIGPKKLPQIARTLGRGFGELRRAADELKGQIDFEAMNSNDEETDRAGAQEDLNGPYEEASPPVDAAPRASEASSPAHEQPEDTASEKTETRREDPVP